MIIPQDTNDSSEILKYNQDIKKQIKHVLQVCCQSGETRWA